MPSTTPPPLFTPPPRPTMPSITLPPSSMPPQLLTTLSTMLPLLSMLPPMRRSPMITSLVTTCTALTLMATPTSTPAQRSARVPLSRASMWSTFLTAGLRSLTTLWMSTSSTTLMSNTRVSPAPTSPSSTTPLPSCTPPLLPTTPSTTLPLLSMLLLLHTTLSTMLLLSCTPPPWLTTQSTTLPLLLTMELLPSPTVSTLLPPLLSPLPTTPLSRDNFE